MNILVSGGCKNGKSHFAQRLARDMAAEQSRRLGRNAPLYYLATMRPADGEDRARIRRHVAEREGWGFTTVEKSEDIYGCLAPSPGAEADPRGVFLLDSVTALLSNEMFRADGTVDLDAPRRVAEDLRRFAAATGSTVFVSDYIYSDAVFYEELTERYRKGLALADRTLARICDRVAEVAFGGVKWIKEDI